MALWTATMQPLACPKLHQVSMRAVTSQMCTDKLVVTMGMHSSLLCLTAHSSVLPGTCREVVVAQPIISSAKPAALCKGAELALVCIGLAVRWLCLGVCAVCGIHHYPASAVSGLAWLVSCHVDPHHLPILSGEGWQCTAQQPG